VHAKKKKKGRRRRRNFILNPRKWANGCQFVRQHTPKDRQHTPYLKQLTRKSTTTNILIRGNIPNANFIEEFLFLCPSEAREWSDISSFLLIPHIISKYMQ
jgi:hypothetical protein